MTFAPNPTLSPEEELQLLLNAPIHIIADSDFYELDIWYDLDSKNYVLFGDSGTRMAQSDDYWYVFFGRSEPDRRHICLKEVPNQHPSYIAKLIQKHNGLSASDFTDDLKLYYLPVLNKEHNYFEQNYAAFEGSEIIASFKALEAETNDVKS